MIDLISNLQKFEDFEANVLPALQEDVKKGLSPLELQDKYAALVTARAITGALKDKSGGMAQSLSKDMLDRKHGKSVERKEVKHTLESLSEAELDSLIKSEEEDLENLEGRFEQ